MEKENELLKAVIELLTGTLNYAVEPMHFIKYTPAVGVKLPSHRAVPESPSRKKDRNIIPAEQWEVIINAFPKVIPVLFHCSLLTGAVYAWEKHKI